MKYEKEKKDVFKVFALFKRKEKFIIYWDG